MIASEWSSVLVQGHWVSELFVIQVAVNEMKGCLPVESCSVLGT